ncbi:hypothetical protein V8F06_000231 [Rhypophila decipiens]
MGLFDGWFGGSGSSKDNSDPLAKLDPKLREFLQKESPVKYTTASEEQQQHRLEQEQRRAKYQQKQLKQQQPPEPVSDEQSKVPQESLYPDGRYAHLWKNYRPLASVEAETKTDHEKLMDVLDAYKDRKAKIGRTALENCADEQLDWRMCMTSGDVRARLTMCSAEVKKFERCYNTQTRLLKALGYLSTYRNPEVDEEIQMRADDMFRQMQKQEEEIAKAKEEGRPIPKFNPVLQTQTTPPVVPAAAAQLPQTTTAAGSAAAEPDAETLESWKGKLDKLSNETDRAAELEALRQEYRAKQDLVAQVSKIKEETAKEREARKAEGKETMGDRFKSFFGN